MMASPLGFIGLGVMGGPMCRNLVTKSGLPVIAYDIRQEPLDRLAEAGARAVAGIAEVAAEADVIFLSLPGHAELEAVSSELLSAARRRSVVVDTSTVPVALTRDMAARFAKQGVDYADAPVARTRAAAEAGTLAVMVGAKDAVLARIRPHLACFASDISHCGGIGAGQVGKLMNNMVLFQSVVALSEALTIARRAGVDGERLFETLSTGSADSFALRNHGMKALMPGDFPERAFSARYALEDLRYAMQLAADGGVAVPGAETAARMLEAAIAAGHGDEYHPTILNVVEKRSGVSNSPANAR
ncbi:MAG: NAD(P)-dependent oxidoreductase [Alphaproteobacteria bacterium]|nr:NAD(P)-dependent oxidoreductase [Alphaproteobacteria bacterium]